MNFLEERIVKDGIVKEGNVLKVDSFLNHQMDIRLFDQIGEEFKKRFEGTPINKILTIEASGIGIACVAARQFDVPVIFAKKSKSINIEGEVYVAEVESFTHKCKNQVIVSKKFLNPDDNVLIIDDFLANGKWLCASGIDLYRDISRCKCCGNRYRNRKRLPDRRTDHPESGISSGIFGDRRRDGYSDRKDRFPGAVGSNDKGCKSFHDRSLVPEE